MEKCLILIEALRKIEVEALTRILPTKLKQEVVVISAIFSFSPRTKGGEGCCANYGRNLYSLISKRESSS